MCVAGLNWVSPAAQHYRTFPPLVIAGANSVTGRTDTQDNADREIEMAYRNGIDYFAYDILADELDYFASGIGNNSVWVGYNRMWDLHRSSAKKHLTKLCINWVGGYMANSAWWASTIQAWIVTQMQDSAYFNVLTNRPIFYLYGADDFVSHDFGGNATNARTALDNMRSAAQSAGLGNPYIVGLGSVGAITNFTALGLDAASIYTCGPSTTGQAFSDFKTIQDTQGGVLIGAHGKYIPAISFGIDWQDISNAGGYPGSYWPPGSGEALPGPWNVPPTDAVMAQWAKDAMDYAATHPLVDPPNTVICYPWDEYTEAAGSLRATRADGGSRLQAVAAKIQRQRESPASYKARGIQPVTR